MILVVASDSSVSHTVGEITAIVALAAAAIWLGLRARSSRADRDRRARTTDAIAALVCLVLLVGGVVRFVDHHSSSGPFDTAQGRQMHAGFLAGCQQGTTGVIDCDCMWDHLTSAPPYDTPEGLLTLAGPVTNLIRTHSTSGLPPQYIEAATSCLGG
ncbi:MAG TPA: hypothetical protein VE972_07250 [Conexibacter sp.]|nr:hypothetical protein [Conexibacter sp.]